MKYILICGCARSGNTLMSFACAAGFERVYRHPGEENPMSVDADDPSKYDWIVSKRPKLEKKVAKLLEKYQDFYAIYMLRDPRAVLVSKHPMSKKKYYTEPERWIESVKRLSEYENHNKVIVVKFEDLIQHPLKCQSEIAAKFGLKKTVGFDKCYEMFEAIDKKGTKSMHGARKLDPGRIESWKDSKQDSKYVEYVINKYKLIPELMEKYGYQ